MPRFQAQERSYFCGPASLRILQSELGCAEPFSQEHWARIMGTTPQGTSCAGIKRGLRQLGKAFKVCTRLPEWITRWVTTPQLVVVYDRERDHWMVASICTNKDLVSIPGHLVVYLLDPEGPDITAWGWEEFRDRFFSNKRESYGLFLTPSLAEAGKAESLRRTG
jgi:hypothetical protein